MRLVICVGVLGMLCATGVAHADWATAGGAYHCDEKTGVFSLLATVDASENSINAPPQHIQLAPGFRAIACQLGSVAIAAVASVSEPQASGVCGAAGSAGILSLAVQGWIAINSESLASPCTKLEPSIVSVRVKRTSEKVVVTICRGKWDWGPEFLEVECKSNDVTLN